MVVAGGPRLGDLRAGAMAAVTGATFPGSAAGSPRSCVRRCSRPDFPALLRYTPVGLEDIVAAMDSVAAREPARPFGYTVDDLRGRPRGRHRRGRRWRARYRSTGPTCSTGSPSDELCPGCAGQVLAPWPNRIRDGHYAFGGERLPLPLTEPSRHNAIHGLVNWPRWRLVERRPRRVTVEHDLVPQPGYPWPLRLRTTWSVGEGGLRAEHEVTNPAPSRARSAWPPTRTCWCPASRSTT